MLRIFFIFILLAQVLNVLTPKVIFADTWAIYWYVCGSDLEERYGAASDDIIEVANANLSKDVKVIMQTGGTKKWEPLNAPDRTIKISSKNIQRYLITDGTFEKLADLPQANMGNPKTLANFLRFCVDNYPADHRILIIWDHGAGSSKDFANDQNYDMRGMTLPNLRSALKTVFGENPKTLPFDIISFDACLMATIDTAVNVHGFTKYLIASQEVESGLGFEYTTPLSNLSTNSTMSPLKFGQIICDSFLNANKAARAKDFDPAYLSTLSIIDVRKALDLKMAWDLIGIEAISTYVDDDEIVGVIGRKALGSEKFLNSKSEGFSNMMDMGSFLQNIRSLYPDTVDLALEALKETVVYNVSGKKHKKAMGISCYYPFDKAKTYKNMLSEHNLSAFVILNGLQFGKINADSALKYFEKIFDRINAYINDESEEENDQQEGAISQTNINDIVASTVNAVKNCKPMTKFDITTLEDWPVTINKDGNIQLTLGKEKCKYLDNIAFYMAIVDTDEDVIVMLGKDADLYSDWKNGIFSSHFQNNWAEINDNLVSLELIDQDEKSFSYAIPAKLNGTRVNIYATYDLENKSYSISGARKITSNDIPEKFLIKLKPGDTITTIFNASKISDGKDFEEVEIDTFKYKDKLIMKDVDLGDCQLAYMFEMTNIQGESALSKMTLITVKDGKFTMKNID